MSGAAAAILGATAATARPPTTPTPARMNSRRLGSGTSGTAGECARRPDRPCAGATAVEVKKPFNTGLAGAQSMVLHDLLAVGVEDLLDALEFIGRQAGVHQPADCPAGDVNPDLQNVDRD